MHASNWHFLPLSSSWHKLVCTWFVKSTVHINPVLNNPYFHYLLWAENLHSKGINFRCHFSGHNWPWIMRTLCSVFQVEAFNMHITRGWVLMKCVHSSRKVHKEVERHKEQWHVRCTKKMNNLDIYPLYQILKTKCRILYSRAIRYISQPQMFDFQFNQCLMLIWLFQLSSFAILGLCPFVKSYIMVICSLLIKHMQLVGIS